MEYDLATDGEFSSRTGGSSNLILNTRPSNSEGSENTYNDGTRVNISIQSGNETDYDNNNYRGNSKIDINFTPSVNKQNFSEGISYGGNCISCGVPDGIKFNAVYWKNTTDDADNVKVYISNVKITKEQKIPLFTG